MSFYYAFGVFSDLKFSLRIPHRESDDYEMGIGLTAGSSRNGELR